MRRFSGCPRQNTVCTSYLDTVRVAKYVIYRNTPPRSRVAVRMSATQSLSGSHLIAFLRSLACGRLLLTGLPLKSTMWNISPLLWVGPSWRGKWDTQSVHPQCRSFREGSLFVFVRRDMTKQIECWKDWSLLSLVSLYLVTKWSCHRIPSVKANWNHCRSLGKCAKPSSLAKASTPSSKLLLCLDPISVATAASAYVTLERPASWQAHVSSIHFSASTRCHNKRTAN